MPKSRQVTQENFHPSPVKSRSGISARSGSQVRQWGDNGRQRLPLFPDLQAAARTYKLRCCDPLLEAKNAMFFDDACKTVGLECILIELSIVPDIARPFDVNRALPLQQNHAALAAPSGRPADVQALAPPSICTTLVKPAARSRLATNWLRVPVWQIQYSGVPAPNRVNNAAGSSRSNGTLTELGSAGWRTRRACARLGRAIPRSRLERPTA